MHPNIKPSQRVAVVGAIDPDVHTAATYTTGWIAAKNFFAYMAIIMAGTLGTNATIDAKIEQATDAAGAGAKDVSGAVITQMTQAGTDKSDKQAIINLRQSQLDIANNFTHFRLSMTVATATSDAGAIVLAMDERYGPASDNDAASVDQINN